MKAVRTDLHDGPARRSFFMLCGGALLSSQVGCTTGPKGGALDGRAAGAFPFDFWEGMQAAAQSSADHTRAAAGRAAATGDVHKIFAFVRDEIALYPPPPGEYDPSTAIRWGTEATLRCGAGTLREKADVLVELCHRAGFTTEFFSDVYVLPSGASLSPHPYDPPIRVSDPKLDRTAVARWRAQLGLPAVPRSVPLFDDRGRDSAAIAGAVLAALGPVTAQTAEPAVPTAGPIVKITVPARDGKPALVRWAIPVAGVELLETLRRCRPPARRGSGADSDRLPSCDQLRRPEHTAGGPLEDLDGPGRSRAARRGAVRPAVQPGGPAHHEGERCEPLRSHPAGSASGRQGRFACSRPGHLPESADLAW